MSINLNQSNRTIVVLLGFIFISILNQKMASTLFYFIVGFIIVEYIVSRYLSYLNSQSWTENLPQEVAHLYDDAKYKKARSYNQVNKRLGILSGVFSLVLILAVLFLDGFAFLDNWLRANVTEDPIWLALSFFGILMILSDILSLPFTLYSTFVIEEKFGFNKTTPTTFVIDKIKGYAITTILGGGMIAALVFFYNWAGSLFWLYAWILVSTISLLFAAFYTSWLLPIFNKLTPLEEGELRAAIEKYASKVDFPLTNIFVMDGSKRSAKANAFFSGMGNKKSIVLYDTLIEEQSTDELVAVLAHEVGHYKKKHIQQSMVISILHTGVILFVLGLALNTPEVSYALGASQPSFHIGILAFSLLFSPISMVTGILMNIFSRKNEFEADAFAKETFNGTALKSALEKLSVNHLSNLTPHPSYVFMYYSHPPLLERLKALGN